MLAALIGTWDSKGRELSYLYEQLSERGVSVVRFDISLKEHTWKVEHPWKQILQSENQRDNHGEGVWESKSREELLTLMADSLASYITNMNEKQHFGAVIGVGGSCGTSLCLPALQRLPASYPRKFMFSTIQTEQQGDIIWIPSVTDVVLNRYSQKFFDSVVGSVSGLLELDNKKSNKQKINSANQKPLVAVTMFGNTSEGATKLQRLLEDSGLCDVVVFHSVGSGGRVMVDAVKCGEIQVVVDLTTTELADELCNGIFSAGPSSERISPITEGGAHHIIAPGCIDMVNFHPNSIPVEYTERKLLHWNSHTTLMRTNAEENREIAKWICESLSSADKQQVDIVLPTLGFSESSRVDKIFHDNEADKAFIQSMEDNNTRDHRITKVEANINDDEFIRRLFEITVQHLPKNSEKLTETPSLIQSRLPLLDSNDKSPRAKSLRKLCAELEAGELIIGAGSGNGLSAKCSIAGGASMLICYNSGRFRMAGVGSLAGLLPFSNANLVVEEMANEILSSVPNDSIVLAGVCGTDPALRGFLMEKWLKKLKKKGFSGVQNFPTVGLMDGLFRENLEETGMSYSSEVEMIKCARNLGLLTTPYVFCSEDVKQMVAAGADIIVIHLGLTASNSIGARTVALNLEQCPSFIQELTNLAHSLRPDVIVLIHGGPLATPSDVEFVLQRTTRVAGFYGASSMERLPVEEAIPQRIKEFKLLSNKS